VAAKYSRLTGKAGSCKGKKIQLKQDSITLGSTRGNLIRLKGDYVSQEHAVIRKRVDARWMIENKSEYGLLVNAERVEARVLVHGDTIQIGSANLLAFEDLQQLNQGIKSPASSTFASLASLKNPKQAGVAALVLVYLVIMAYLLSDRLGGESSRRVALSMETFTRAIDATIDYANSGQVNLDDAFQGLDKSTPNYLFYELATLSVNPSTATVEKEARSEQLRQELENMFLRAYQHQQMGQYRRAIEIINEVYLMIPDPRAPIAQYCLQVLGSLKEEAARG